MTLRAGLRSNGLDTQSNARQRSATHSFAVLIFCTTSLLYGNLLPQDGVLRYATLRYDTLF